MLLIVRWKHRKRASPLPVESGSPDRMWQFLEHFCHSRGTGKLRTCISMRPSHHAERYDHSIHRSTTDARKVACFFACYLKQATCRGQCIACRKLQSTEQLLDLPKRINPGYRFLAEIASLIEADSSGIPINLLRKVFRRDIPAKQGRTCLDT